jgi:hypothetical protein
MPDPWLIEPPFSPVLPSLRGNLRGSSDTSQVEQDGEAKQEIRLSDNSDKFRDYQL